MNNHYPQQQNSKGAALLIFVVLFLFGSLTLSVLLSKSIYADLAGARVLQNSKQSYYTALAANEDMAYRYLNNLTPDLTEVVTIAGITATSTVVYDGVSDSYTITSEGSKDEAVRSSQITIRVTDGTSFGAGLQSGEGGISLQNTATVYGDIYANGDVIGANSNIIYGDVVSAGPDGLIDGVHATGSAYANSIGISRSTLIEGDAYYQSINLGNTTVWGSTHPGSTDLATTALPIPDSVILAWEAEAEAGGTYSGPCPYVIESDVSIGPLKVPCDMEIDKNGTEVTLTGPIWVEGNLTITKGEIIVDGSLVDTMVPFIAHDASDPSSSKITAANGISFSSDSGDSYTLLISMNADGENGGSDKAISVKNSSNGEMIVYASHGIIEIENNTTLRQGTAYRIEAKNSAQVRFKKGLIIPDGATGTFSISSWSEVE